MRLPSAVLGFLQWTCRKSAGASGVNRVTRYERGKAHVQGASSCCKCSMRLAEHSLKVCVRSIQRGKTSILCFFLNHYACLDRQSSCLHVADVNALQNIAGRRLAQWDVVQVADAT